MKKLSSVFLLMVAITVIFVIGSVTFFSAGGEQSPGSPLAKKDPWTKPMLIALLVITVGVGIVWLKKTLSRK